MEQLERDRLITENIRLVYYVYEKLSKNDITVRYKDDIVSEGTVGLIKAARNFDGDKGYKFATYAVRCIRNEMLMFLRRLNRQVPYEVSINTPIGKDKDGNELCLADTLESEYGNPETEIDKSVFYAFMDKQKLKDKKIVAAICNGFSQKDIAKELNVLQPTVRIEAAVEAEKTGEKRAENSLKKFRVLGAFRWALAKVYGIVWLQNQTRANARRRKLWNSEAIRIYSKQRLLPSGC